MGLRTFKKGSGRVRLFGFCWYNLCPITVPRRKLTAPRHRPECVFGSTKKTSQGVKTHLEKLTFLRRLTLRNLFALTYFWTLGLLRVSKHTIKQGLHIEKLTILRHGLEETVINDMAIDLQIPQGVKTRFQPKLEKSCTMNLPVDLDKTLVTVRKFEKTLVTLRKYEKTWRYVEKTRTLPDLETQTRTPCLQRATLRKIRP